jgi:hypothetical protein
VTGSYLERELRSLDSTVRARLSARLEGWALREPRFDSQQLRLRAWVDTLRDLQSFADEFGGDLIFDESYDMRRWHNVQVFTEVVIEGVKARVSATGPWDEIDAYGVD